MSKDYKSPSEVVIRKKAGLKETQTQDWEGVGLPTRKGKGRPFNLVKKGNIIKGGKGFKKKKGIKKNIVKDVNVDMFKDRPYKKKK